ncbi:5-formyltetrahydrofolate cyclo-ligase [Candidatus Woesearchaeota archaeon CG_4_10_14_0_8_um_filter_47_5]|nr:MAG: 5-formyltetrahydrofolate cyclo-ligase [Candidatus Woesearchaeota archaeon CG_4_10_14_0_8_um_filter_47_5]
MKHASGAPSEPSPGALHGAPLKQALRHQFRNLRSCYPQSELKKKAMDIHARLETLEEYRHAHSILFYVSYNNEVDTVALIRRALAASKQVYVPFMKTDIFGKKRIELSLLRSLDELAPGAFGIHEPKKECIRPVTLSKAEVILVPGVVFDALGYRLGSGHGYYDRLLMHAHTTTIGLAYEFQVIDNISPEPHDIPLDIIATETKILRIKPVKP